MIPKLRILLAIAALLSACSAPERAPARQKDFDVLPINNVWRQAKLRGVSFRAIGQEPGWLLEITSGAEILLVTDYGRTRSAFPYVEPVVHQEERRTEFHLPSFETVIEIRGEPCRDVMSGEEFEVSVTIKQPDRGLQGCGRTLH